MVARVLRPLRAAALPCLCLALLSLSPSPVEAQEREPLPLFVVDAQGALPRLPTEQEFWAPRGLGDGTLPSWGTGINLAAHVYPLRGRRVSLGVGANYQWMRGSRTPEVPEGSTTPPGPTVTTRFTGFAPQVSINFGHRRGWSYLSAGLGSAALTISRDDALEEEPQGVTAINWGGGARWFARDHLAFSFDVRIYRMPELAASNLSAGHPAMNLLVFNVGISLQ
ncbi:MAG: hypothetical protein MUF60_11290 [Vicinamibacterales bacterium]|nr:hypothetical protein [Vicinamibacterales bacterium]